MHEKLIKMKSKEIVLIFFSIKYVHFVLVINFFKNLILSQKKRKEKEKRTTSRGGGRGLSFQIFSLIIL